MTKIRTAAHLRVCGIRPWLFSGTFIAVLAASSIFAGPFSVETNVELGDLPHNPPTPSAVVYLGDRTSDGTGVATYVRPTRPTDLLRDFDFYPPFQDRPPTPAQEGIWLMEGVPLTFVIPALGGFPVLQQTAVNFSVDGFTIDVTADTVSSQAHTATIYGPNEYLLKLGSLPAGDYRLTYRRSDSTIMDGATIPSVFGDPDYGFGYSAETYIEFTVHAVPEPATGALAATGLISLLCIARIRRAAR